jgi:hypothetical protein
VANRKLTGRIRDAQDLGELRAIMRQYEGVCVCGGGGGRGVWS